MDHDYATVAARRGGGSPPSPSARRRTLVAFGVAVAALAVLLTVSAVQTRDTAAGRARPGALIARIQSEQGEVADIRDRVDSLGTEVAELRTSSLAVSEDAAALEDTLEDLKVVTGTIPVSGPGLRITVDDAPSGSTEGQISDTDLQRLANGLWEAGAEAVAVGGQRLTTRSAIRTAGQAITVNYRSLSPPYVVPPSVTRRPSPPTSQRPTPASSSSTCRTTFGIGFVVESPGSVTLPGRPLDVDQASREGDRP